MPIACNMIIYYTTRVINSNKKNKYVIRFQ